MGAIRDGAGRGPGSVLGGRRERQIEDGDGTAYAWGDPDLQGVWSYASLTPLERPAAVDGREFFTREEAAGREADTAGGRASSAG